MVRIAIVKDVPDDIRTLRAHLDRYTAKYGIRFKLTCFANGDEIVENYKSGFDIIFMDVEMPFSMAWMPPEKSAEKTRRRSFPQNRQNLN